jgi:glycosyltransferase involved in cell wall biosynthesis
MPRCKGEGHYPAAVVDPTPHVGAGEVRLSVVTPALDQVRYIGETLESVARVPLDHEHIVIDGGSTDGTVELLRQREDPRLSWVSEADRGQTDAVNKGMRRARGDYVGWINADDAYVSAGVARAVSHLDAHPGVGAVYGFMEITDAQGLVTRTYRPAPFNWIRYLWLGDYVPTTAIIFRRRLLEERGVLDEQFRDAADYDFYLRLFHGVQVDRIDEPIVRFRYHSDSKTARDPGLGQREALQIRLRWARGARDAALMRAVDDAKQRLFAVVPPWPPGRMVTRAADAVYALRDRSTSR